MGTPRKLGMVLCLLGFLAVCVLALVSRTNGPFAGLPGIEDDLAERARSVVEVDAPGAVVSAEGRDLSVQLPELVNSTYDPQAFESSLKDLDGVRSVEIIGNPMVALDPADRPDPDPTAPAATPEATTEPTAEPTSDPTAEPTVEATAPSDPTAEPAPDPTATSEPTPEPTAEPTPEPAPPSLAEIVEEIDLDGLDFEPGTATFTVQDTIELDAVADRLLGVQETSGGPIQVQAHTDNIGDPDANLLLSQLRAEAVVTYLTARGVDSSLLTARGYGAQLPIADNDTEAGRAANERVVLVVEGN